MGKIRVKTIGSEEEQIEKKEDQKRKEAKKMTKAPGMKGGERVVTVGPTEEELEQLETPQPEEEVKEEKKKEVKKSKEDKKQKRSERYKKASSAFDKSKQYKLAEAIETLKGLNKAKFDETVELHLNVTDKGISGTVTLPHGTGKQTRVVIADDEVIAEIEKGKINFDVLLAEPSMMPKLAKVARVLGPRGLMPNPKNGTISNNPKDLMKKYEGGHFSYKTEAKFPIMHLMVGKVSFEDKKLEENIKTIISAIKKENIKKAVLKSTMSPGIRISL